MTVEVSSAPSCYLIVFHIKDFSRAVQPNKVATSHVRLYSIWNVASEMEEMNLPFSLIWIHLHLNNHM